MLLFFPLSVPGPRFNPFFVCTTKPNISTRRSGAQPTTPSTQMPSNQRYLSFMGNFQNHVFVVCVARFFNTLDLRQGFPTDDREDGLLICTIFQ